MKSKQILKIIVDIFMTVTLLLLMAYSLVYGSNPAVGEAVHEWFGIGMFVLFVLHHFLNRKWSFSVFKKLLTSDVEVSSQFFPIISCVSHYLEARPFTPSQISFVVSAMISSSGIFFPSAIHCL